MFGRIRESSSSLESLELERPHSKILKEDSLSIYEATLVKLKLGSQRNLNSLSKHVGHIDAGSVSSSTCMEPMKIEVNSYSPNTFHECSEVTSSLNEELMTVDTDEFSPEMDPSFRVSDSVSKSKQQDKTSASILYLFSKFKNAQNAVSSTSEDSLTVENGISVNISPSYSSS